MTDMSQQQQQQHQPRQKRHQWRACIHPPPPAAALLRLNRILNEAKVLFFVFAFIFNVRRQPSWLAGWLAGKKPKRQRTVKR